MTIAHGNFAHRSWALAIQGRHHKRCYELSLTSPRSSSATGTCQPSSPMASREPEGSAAAGPRSTPASLGSAHGEWRSERLRNRPAGRHQKPRPKHAIEDRPSAYGPAAQMAARAQPADHASSGGEGGRPTEPPLRGAPFAGDALREEGGSLQPQDHRIESCGLPASSSTASETFYVGRVDAHIRGQLAPGRREGTARIWLPRCAQSQLVHGPERLAAQVAAAALRALAEQDLAALPAVPAGALRGRDDLLRHGAIVARFCDGR